MAPHSTSNARPSGITHLWQGIRRRRHEGLEKVHDVSKVPKLGVHVEKLRVVAGEVQPRLLTGKPHLQADLRE